MNGCFRCGIGNLPKGIKVEWVKVGAHNISYIRVYCSCATGVYLEKQRVK